MGIQILKSRPWKSPIRPKRPTRQELLEERKERRRIKKRSER